MTDVKRSSPSFLFCACFAPPEKETSQPSEQTPPTSDLIPSVTTSTVTPSPLDSNTNIDPSNPTRTSKEIHPNTQKETVPSVEDGDPGATNDETDEEKELHAIEDKVTTTTPLAASLPADARLTLAMFAKAVSTIGHELLNLANEWQEGRYTLRYQYQSMGGKRSTKPVLPRHVVSLPKAEAFSSEKIGAIVARGHQFLRAQMPLLARLREGLGGFKDLGYDVFKGFFGAPELFPMPRGVLSEEEEFWKRDEVFAMQFLRGCNPILIERVRGEEGLKRIPKEFKDIKVDGMGIRNLMKEERLYVVDYALLAQEGVAEGMHESGAYYTRIRFGGREPDMIKWFYAPFVVLYEKDGELKVFGIMLTRKKDGKNAIYNKESCKECEVVYTFAKMHVACADNQVHQFWSHLGRCHLTYEPFGVAVRNVFEFGEDKAKKHVVGKLLREHFLDHMAINWLARNTLIAHGDDSIAFTDAGFALGTKGGVRILASEYSKWKFTEQALPKQFERRGFKAEGDELKGYFYREDGMRVWNAILKYVTRELKEFYKGKDKDLKEDKVLKAWCEEMRDPERAFVPSFPELFTSIEQLAEAVTTIIYHVSAEHAAVNASQERYLSYVPNRPNALFRRCPLPGEEMSMKEVLGIHRMGGTEYGASMPLAFAVFQVQFSQLLTLKPTKTLMCVPGLREELEEVHYVIKARNLQVEEGKAPYEFLDPVQIGMSIEI